MLKTLKFVQSDDSNWRPLGSCTCECKERATRGGGCTRLPLIETGVGSNPHYYHHETFPLASARFDESPSGSLYDTLATTTPTYRVDPQAKKAGYLMPSNSSKY